LAAEAIEGGLGPVLSHRRIVSVARSIFDVSGVSRLWGKPDQKTGEWGAGSATSRAHDTSNCGRQRDRLQSVGAARLITERPGIPAPGLPRPISGGGRGKRGEIGERRNEPLEISAAEAVGALDSMLDYRKTLRRQLRQLKENTAAKSDRLAAAEKQNEESFRELSARGDGGPGGKERGARN
jgi:hypothetical protein